MPKSHRPYAPEFRRQMVDLVRSGRTPEELSREFEPTAQAIWNWVRQADRDVPAAAQRGRRDGHVRVGPGERGPADPLQDRAREGRGTRARRLSEALSVPGVRQ